MKSLNKDGFTIIETMLFLGITGLLVMGILAGAGTSINVQRYHDSVTSLQSILQRQFSDSYNASNGSKSSECESVNVARGQSDCVILGKLITTSGNKTLIIRGVIGSDPDGNTEQNDIDELQRYNVSVTPQTEEYDIEWGSSMAIPVSGADKSFSMLIVRSPKSGVLRTFIEPNRSISDNEIRDLINEDALKQTTKICIKPNGLFSAGNSAVVINANATNASGIETFGEATSGC